MKNEADQSGARRLEMIGYKKVLHGYNIRARIAKLNYKSGAEISV